MRARGWRLAVVAPLGLAAAFGAGVLLATDDAGETADPRSLRRAAVVQPATTTSSDATCDDLLDLYVGRGLGLVGPSGWGSGLPTPYPLAVDDLAAAGDTVQRSESVAAAPATTRATASAGGTTVQEGAVDEPDSVKTDGSLLVRVEDGALVVADVSGPSLRELSRLELPVPAPPAKVELLLSDDTVVVLGEAGVVDATGVGGDGSADTRATLVTTIDVSVPTLPTVTSSVTYDTGLLAARLHGGTVRLVLDAGLPRLDFLRPGPETGDETARLANLSLVRESTLDDWLPTRSVDGAAGEGFLDCEDVVVPEGRLGLGLTAVVGFEAADGPGAASAAAPTGLAAATDVAYASADHLYLAAAGTEAGLGGFGDLAAPLCREVCVPAYDAGTTWVHDFALGRADAGTTATYVGAAEVEGRLADRWSLDEHDGVLRLALEASSQTADATSLVTLGPDPQGGQALVEVGRLDGVGREEDLTAVRWFDDLAVLVTFRRIDPLHVVDLSDATRPTQLSELEIPGFSEYLHPLGADRLLGIGQGPVAGPDRPWGAQAGLFDVTDLADVRRIDTTGFGPGSRAGAATDPRQLTWLPGRRTVLTVVVRGWRSPVARVATLRIDGGRMQTSTRAVDRGPDVDAVRLVPLPDERVVLVTADGARFYEV